MIEINSDILVIGIGLIIGLLIIKLLTKFLFRAIGIFILIIVGGGYAYFFTDFFEKHSDNAVVQAIEDKIDFVSVIEYQETHCLNGPMSRNDSITCECIISPLVEDLKTNFSGAELEELQKDKKKYMKEIVEALKRNEDEIQEKLKERKALDIWNKMVRNLKKGEIIWNY